jgi:hypothetical protein
VAESNLRSVRESAKRGRLDLVREHLRSGETELSPTSLLRLVTNDYHSVKKTEGHAEAAELLIGAGATVDQEMVYQVSRGGSSELMVLLSATRDRRDVFHAASCGQAAMLDAQLAHDSSIASMSDEFGRTPLHYCAASSLWKGSDDTASCFKRCAEILLSHGAEVSATAPCGGLDDITPLEHACWTGGSEDVFDLLILHGAQLSERALWAAVGHFQRHGDGHYVLAAKLLSLGMDVNAGDRRTMLHAFAAHEDKRGVTWLIDHGAAVDRADVEGKTPLHAAAERNTGVSVVTALIEAGASTAALDRHGRTALDLAIEKGRKRLVTILEQHASVA